MTYSPYTPGELTELRQTAADVQRAAPGAQAWPIVHKLIATVAALDDEATGKTTPCPYDMASHKAAEWTAGYEYAVAILQSETKAIAQKADEP